MATIINSSFFVRDFTIPNLASTSQGGLAINERVQSFIDKYEPECLLKILGYPLYKLFGTESSIRMTNLLSGIEYSDACGQLTKWQGIKHDNDQSLIAAYVYFFIEEWSATQTAGTNTNVPKGMVSTAVSPRDKMNKAWNFFSDEVKSMISFLWLKKNVDGVTRTYPEFTAHQYRVTENFSRKINNFGF